MSSDDRLIATRYVKALFDLATEGKVEDAVKADLQTLNSILQSSSEFQKLLVNPVISRKKSEQAMARVLVAINASELTKKFFALLARQRRLMLTSLAIENYLELLARARGEITAHVTTAQALSSDEMTTLTGAIAKSTGKKVTLKTRENPDLIGGLQVRVGSQMLDNSVAGKLSRLKQTLTNVA